MKENLGVKSWFFPLPVLIIGTYDENGNPNAMNAAWGGLYDSNLVQICLSAGHKTTKNIKQSGAFTISFATAEKVEACDFVGLVSGNDITDKMQKAGFTTEKSQFVNAPLINELPLALECELIKITEEGNVIGEIKNIAADQSIINEKGKIDIRSLNALIFEPSGCAYYTFGEKAGDAFSCGGKLK